MTNLTLLENSEFQDINYMFWRLRTTGSVSLADEEAMLLSYRAAKDKILKMSIYDSNSGKDVQEAITQFFAFSGTTAVEREWA